MVKSKHEPDNCDYKNQMAIMCIMQKTKAWGYFLILLKKVIIIIIIGVKYSEDNDEDKNSH